MPASRLLAGCWFIFKAGNMTKQKQHYAFMAALMMIIALIGTLRFDMHDGYYWLIPCFFGFVTGIYIYAAINTKR